MVAEGRAPGSGSREVIRLDHVRAEFPAHARSIRAARALVRDALSSWDLHHLEDVATLLVSELATNALLHARTDFAVEAVRRRDVLRVMVLDCSPAMPHPRRHSLEAGTGRGLSLIETLAGSWGSEISEDPWAKGVWFELPTAATAGR